MAIAYELRRKGIDGEIIDEAVGSITDEEEEKQALKIANKYYERYKGLEDEEIAVKIGQALARRVLAGILFKGLSEEGCEGLCISP